MSKHTTHPHTDSNAYKAVARAWAATVNVVTAKHKDTGATDGFTATAFLTVSINPPIVLVSVTNSSSAAEILSNASGFVVNVLAQGQEELANGFAKPQTERAVLLHDLENDEAGVPMLAGTMGGFSCTVRQLVPAGDHTLVLGDVVAIHHGHVATDNFDSLVYHNRAYKKLG